MRFVATVACVRSTEIFPLPSYLYSSHAPLCLSGFIWQCVRKPQLPQRRVTGSDHIAESAIQYRRDAGIEGRAETTIPYRPVQAEDAR